MGDADGQSDLGHRIDLVLSEFRIIVPGLAALLGFQFTVAFTEAFSRTPDLERWLHIAAVLANVAAIAFLLIPPGYNRFAPGAEDTEEFLRFVVHCVKHAFTFIAVTLVLSLYVQSWKVTGSRLAAAAIAVGVALSLLAGWWFVPLRRARMKHGGAT